MNMNVRTNQGGFTLIELVIVIVLLGILAAVAVPRFLDMQGEAQQAVVEGAAGALASASAINFAAVKVDNPGGITLGEDACDALTAQVTGDVFDQVSIQADADCSAAASGEAATCTLEHDDDDTRTAEATIICT